MLRPVFDILKHSCIDRAVLCSRALQLVNILKGPLLVSMLSLVLSANDLGVWYTFVSLGALIALSDLGFSNNLMHYVAKNLSKSCTQSGEDLIVGLGSKALALKKIVLVFLLFLFVIVVCVFVAGLFILESHFVSWGVFCFASCLLVVFATFQNIVMGYAEVHLIYLDKVISVLAGLMVTVFCLLIGLGVSSLVFGTTVVSLAYFATTVFRERGFLLKLIRIRGRGSKAEFREALALNVKNGAYWIGYVGGFQVIVPAVFVIYGAEVAGVTGVWFAVLLAVHNFSSAALNAKLPGLTRLVSLRGAGFGLSQTHKLVVEKLVMQALISLAIVSIILFIPLVAQLLKVSRLVDYLYFSVAFLVTGFAHSWASSFRVFGVEAMWVQSLLTLVGVLLLLLYCNLNYLEFSLFSVSYLMLNLLIILPISLFFVKKNLVKVRD